MARKSKRDDLAALKAPTNKPPKPDPTRQPRIVGWLVLVVGGFSSWYWYRPLPDNVNQTVHSTLPSDWPTSLSGPKSMWSEQNLIIPSTLEAAEILPEPRVDFGNQRAEESRLIGAPKVTLVPFHEVQHDFREVLKNERVPMVPIAPDVKIGNTASNAPQVWTPEHHQKNSIEGLTPSNSMWPDEGYVPIAKIQKEQRRSAVKITTQIPPLLETGMKSIRTSDTEGSIEAGYAANPKKSASDLASTPEPTRTPQFIRQPKREK